MEGESTTDSKESEPDGPATQQQVQTDHGTMVSRESLPSTQGTRRNRRSRRRVRTRHAISAYNLYYVKSQGGKNEQQTKNDEKPDNGFQSQNNVHRITPMSEKEELARLVLQWCLVVARIAPDSPRLAWYCSRWNVPGKIADAAAAGTLADTLAGCPPIDRKHLPAGIAAVSAWHDYQQPPMLPDTEETRLQARQSASAA